MNKPPEIERLEKGLVLKSIKALEADLFWATRNLVAAEIEHTRTEIARDQARVKHEQAVLDLTRAAREMVTHVETLEQSLAEATHAALALEATLEARVAAAEDLEGPEDQEEEGS